MAFAFGNLPLVITLSAIVFFSFSVPNALGQQHQVSPPQRVEHTKEPDNQNQERTDPPKLDATPRTTISSGVAQIGDKTKPDRKSENRSFLQNAFAPEYLSNWFLFLAGVFGLIFAFRTLQALVRQTRATEIAADAAQKSADAAIRSAITTEKALKLSERAEVLLERADIKFSQAGQFDSHAWLELSIKNFGRTRANEVAGDFKFVVQGVDNRVVTLSPTTLGAGHIQSVAFDRFCNILPEVFNEVLKSEKGLEFCGIFTYLDVFGDRYTTQCSGTFEADKQAFRIDVNQAG